MTEFCPTSSAPSSYWRFHEELHYCDTLRQQLEGLAANEKVWFLPALFSVPGITTHLEAHAVLSTTLRSVDCQLQGLSNDSRTLSLLYPKHVSSVWPTQTALPEETSTQASRKLAGFNFCEFTPRPLPYK